MTDDNIISPPQFKRQPINQAKAEQPAPTLVLDERTIVTALMESSLIRAWTAQFSPCYPSISWTWNVNSNNGVAGINMFQVKGQEKK